ncbi:MAG: hypothetical protein QOK21_2147 [Solirubrobacteraceae bacterium]|nr:hypothetical protein [Solirubrobacteraceae bacterium]
MPSSAPAPFLHLQALRAVLDGVAAHPAAIVDSGLARSVFPTASVTTGALMWPAGHAHRVLHEWALWTRTVPQDVTSTARLVRFPRLPGVPPELRGRALVIVEVAIPGEPWVAQGRLAALRRLAPEIDTVVLGSADDVPSAHLGLDLPASASGCHVPLCGVDAELVDAFLAVAGPGSGAALASAELRHLGTGYAASAASRATTEDDESRLDVRLGLFAERLAPWVEGHVLRTDAMRARVR